MRQREVFELRISTRVARRDHCELTEICAGGDKAIGKRERKNYPRDSRAERLRDTESAKTLMAAFPSFAWRNRCNLVQLGTESPRLLRASFEPMTFLVRDRYNRQ